MVDIQEIADAMLTAVKNYVEERLEVVNGQVQTLTDSVSDYRTSTLEAIKDMQEAIARLDGSIQGIEALLDKFPQTTVDQATQAAINVLQGERDALTETKEAINTSLLDMVKRLEEVEKKEPVAGKDGRDGKDGADGQDGRDALSVDVLSSIDTERSYPPRTYASHRGGLWVSRRKTHGMDGWECIVDGVDETSVIQEDERNISVSLVKSSGDLVKKDLVFPVMIYRGIYRDTETYAVGDVCTYSGSSWIAIREDAGRPGTEGCGWKLSVKCGRDGKPGKDAKVSFSKGSK